MDGASPKKKDMLSELFGDRIVGGTLSELANYSNLFMKMSEAVFLVDRTSYRVLECNPAALELLKKPEESVLGQELPSVLKNDVFLRSKLKNPFPKTEMPFASDRGDERVFEVEATPLKILDYIEVIQFIARDVTTVKRAERELKEMNEALVKLSTTDEMTGLKNYRYFKEILASVHHQATSFKHPYGIIFIDVDHFKKFNDRNGHPAGDEVLRGVARILKESSRTQDLPARYGGEEFVVLCRNSSLTETKLQAEVIRNQIRNFPFQFGEFQPLGRVSASIGVAVYPDHGRTCDEVLEKADNALYTSKEGGRDRVSTASDAAVEKAAPHKKVS